MNKRKKRFYLAEIWIRYRRNKPALIGLVILAIIILLAIFADVIAPYEEYALAQNADMRFLAPSKDHILGTDGFGRDTFARLIHGARWSLAFGFGGATVIFLIGSLIGAAVTLIGGKLDEIVTRVVDIILSIPHSILLISLVVLFGRGFKALLLALIISSAPGNIRLCRMIFLSIVNDSYIETARANGCSMLRVIFSHIIPNAVSLLMINFSTSVSSMTLSAAGYSYLGLGIQPPTPEWGSMLSEAQSYMRIYPNSVIWPGIIIVIVSISLILVGDGMGEALDPKKKESL